MGTLSLTNLAPGRSDNVDQSTVRGLLTTPDGTKFWVELDGIASPGVRSWFPSVSRSSRERGFRILGGGSGK